MIISVITPSYSQAPFLAETIESVIGQEGDFLIDYIIVDGASGDGSVEIIRRYAELLERGQWPLKCRGIDFRWVSEPDRGQTDALLKGFAMARGELLAWLCSDDCYLPGALQHAAAAFRRETDLSLLYGDAVYCSEAGETIGRYPVEDFDLNRLAGFNFICQPATFFRSAALAAVGGLDRSLHFAMDYDLFIRIGKRFRCRHLAATIARYRLHHESKTVRNEALLANHEETLAVALKHFGRAPLNYVYGRCRYACLDRLPHLAAFGPLVLPAALACTVLQYLRLNGGMCREDLRLLTPRNLARLFKGRRELLLDAGTERKRQ